MKVTVKLFATLRHAAGWAERGVDLEDDATIDVLIDHLAAREPQLNLAQRTLYVAVNQEYADRDRVLSDGDEVALFPPVSGGTSWRGDAEGWAQ